MVTATGIPMRPTNGGVDSRIPLSTELNFSNITVTDFRYDRGIAGVIIRKDD